MPDATLHQHERDADFARAKLSHDLSRLKQPSAVSDAAQHFMDKASDKVHSKATNLVEEIKAKAAANPIAALAIGAGIGWRLIRNPPIATALIGAGLFSLLRTPTPAAAADDDFDPVQTGMATLKTQVQGAAASARAGAEDLGNAFMARAGDAATAAGERLHAATQAAQEKASAAVDAVTKRADTLSSAAAEQASAVKKSVSETAASVRDGLSETYHASASYAADAKARIDGAAEATRDAAWDQTERLVSKVRETDAATQDRVLLAVASTAVVLALGFALRAQSPPVAPKS